MISFAKKLTKSKYKKLLKIDLIETDKLMSLNQISNAVGIDYQTLKKYKKYLEYVGKGISNSREINQKGRKFQFGKSEFYKPITKKEFYKKLKLKI